MLDVTDSLCRSQPKAPDDHRTVERRSLAYHQLIASRLSAQAVRRACATLADWEACGEIDPYWIGRYRTLLAQPLAQLKRTLVADTQDARELRHAGLFIGVLSQRERERILRAVH